MSAHLAPWHDQCVAPGRLPEGSAQLWTEGPGQRFGVFRSHLCFPSLFRGLRAKYERAHHARGTSSTVDEAQGVLGDLALSSPAHDLAGCLNHVSETASPTHRLATGDLAAVGIDREAPFVGRIDRIEEGADFSLLAESSIFEAHGREE